MLSLFSCLFYKGSYYNKYNWYRQGKTVRAQCPTCYAHLFLPNLSQFLIHSKNEFSGHINEGNPILFRVSEGWSPSLFQKGSVFLCEVKMGAQIDLRAPNSWRSLSNSDGMANTKLNYTLRRQLWTSGHCIPLVLHSGEVCCLKAFCELLCHWFPRYTNHRCFWCQNKDFYSFTFRFCPCWFSGGSVKIMLTTSSALSLIIFLLCVFDEVFLSELIVWFW